MVLLHCWNGALHYIIGKSTPQMQDLHKFVKSGLLLVRYLMCVGLGVCMHICDRIWEKVHCRAYFQNRVIGTAGRVSSQL